MKDFERRGLSWIFIQVGSECNHMHLYKRKAEFARDTPAPRRGGDVKTEAEIGVTGLRPMNAPTSRSGN